MARRKLARRKKVSIWVAGIGVATGVAAVILWPLIKKMRFQPSLLLSEKASVDGRHIVFDTPEGY